MSILIKKNDFPYSVKLPSELIALCKYAGLKHSSIGGGAVRDAIDDIIKKGAIEKRRHIIFGDSRSGDISTSVLVDKSLLDSARNVSQNSLTGYLRMVAISALEQEIAKRPYGFEFLSFIRNGPPSVEHDWAISSKAGMA